MSYTDKNWYPSAKHIENAHVTALARKLGLKDYASMLAYSAARPADYWEQANDFLAIRWSKPPKGYVDLSRGIELPAWFPGGELNWVETILQYADNGVTKDRWAIIAEQEDGTSHSVRYSDLRSLVRRCAAGLCQAGIRRGDRVGLLCENGVEATLSVLALSYIGAIVAPLFSGFGEDAIVSRLEASGARGLIATTGFSRRGRPVDIASAIGSALARLPAIDTVIWKRGSVGAVPEGGLIWDQLADTSDDGTPAVIMSANDPFMVIYTSGTTGKPKGAVHTHGGFPLKIAHDSAVHFDVGPGDVFCWPTDMGWIAGTLVLASALLRGATLVCYDGAPDYPDWSRMSRVIERHGVTHYGSAPTLIRGLAANTPLSLAGDRSKVELLITAGEVIDPDHFTWFRRNFAPEGCPLINYTGGTEVSGALLSSVVVKPIAPSGFNTASPGVDVAVVDEAGRPVTGVVGELAVRAPFVGMTQSFWQDDARYLETYWSTIPGMWIHGDLALQSAGGEFIMMGRSDDTLKVAGKRLGPAEVEELVIELPEVSEAAAIGVDDAVKGERLVVFVVPVPGWGNDQEGLAASITSRVEQRLGKPFKPSNVHVVTQLPKTRSSKVMRRVIKRICCELPLGDLSALDNPASLDEIQTVINKS